MKKNMAILATLFLMIMAASGVQAQETFTLSGQVTWRAGIVALSSEAREMSGKPVVGAKVRLGPGNLTATTDENGMFTITGVKRGSYTMHVKAREHSSTTKIKVMNQDTWVDVTLLWRALKLGKGDRNVEG